MFWFFFAQWHDVWWETRAEQYLNLWGFLRNMLNRFIYLGLKLQKRGRRSIRMLWRLTFSVTSNVLVYRTNFRMCEENDISFIQSIHYFKLFCKYYYKKKEVFWIQKIMLHDTHFESYFFHIPHCFRGNVYMNGFCVLGMTWLWKLWHIAGPVFITRRATNCYTSIFHLKTPFYRIDLYDRSYKAYT